MNWTKDQLDYRAMVCRTLERYSEARATVWGIEKIFPPIERPSIVDIRHEINLAVTDPARFAREVDRRDPRTTLELLKECFDEVGVDVCFDAGGAPPYTVHLLRFRARSRPAAASV